MPNGEKLMIFGKIEIVKKFKTWMGAKPSTIRYQSLWSCPIFVDSFIVFQTLFSNNVWRFASESSILRNTCQEELLQAEQGLKIGLTKSY